MAVPSNIDVTEMRSARAQRTEPYLQRRVNTPRVLRNSQQEHRQYNSKDSPQPPQLTDIKILTKLTLGERLSRP